MDAESTTLERVGTSDKDGIPVAETVAGAVWDAGVSSEREGTIIGEFVSEGIVMTPSSEFDTVAGNVASTCFVSRPCNCSATWAGSVLWCESPSAWTLLGVIKESDYRAGFAAYGLCELQ
ncbi:hypothetical protein CIHG_02953 [Coccidioides immitis H538.4]|uniref:Uncharacterized protein n=1 Tax=Coccidioides immitis H538.4 TaxID=396776 RepID=A0A0J8RKK8_COCIT|nr:hypothetical protein CIHG_02953 [Coccidioides immitis H538.4]